MPSLEFPVLKREDAAFVVDVPELPGCMAHSATLPDAVAKAQRPSSSGSDAATAAGRPTASLATAPQVEVAVSSRDRKYSVRPSGDHRGWSGQTWSFRIRVQVVA